jgi:hypothetical protein
MNSITLLWKHPKILKSVTAAYVPIVDTSLREFSSLLSFDANNPAINFRSFTKEVHFTKGSKDELSSYSFGRGDYDHWFCPVCGSGLACNKKDGSQYGTNLRSVEGVDVKKLTYSMYDGANLL